MQSFKEDSTLLTASGRRATAGIAVNVHRDTSKSIETTDPDSDSYDVIPLQEDNIYDKPDPDPPALPSRLATAKVYTKLANTYAAGE